MHILLRNVLNNNCNNNSRVETLKVSINKGTYLIVPITLSFIMLTPNNNQLLISHYETVDIQLMKNKLIIQGIQNV